MISAFLPRPIGFILIGIVWLTAAGTLILAFSNPEQVHGSADLTTLSSRFKDYNWSANGKENNLSFKLQDFKEKFFLPPAFISGLDTGAFKAISYGEPVNIHIPVFALPYLNTREKKIPVYGIQQGNKVVLNSAFTLEEVKSRSRTLLLLTLAGAAGISALLFLFSKKKAA